MPRLNLPASILIGALAWGAVTFAHAETVQDLGFGGHVTFPGGPPQRIDASNSQATASAAAAGSVSWTAHQNGVTYFVSVIPFNGSANAKAKCPAEPPAGVTCTTINQGGRAGVQMRLQGSDGRFSVRRYFLSQGHQFGVSYSHAEPEAMVRAGADVEALDRQGEQFINSLTLEP